LDESVNGCGRSSCQYSRLTRSPLLIVGSCLERSWLLGCSFSAVLLRLESLSEAYRADHVNFQDSRYHPYSSLHRVQSCEPHHNRPYTDYYISSPSPHPLSTITSFINPPVHPISTHKVPDNPSLVRSITSISSAQFSIYVSIANNLSYSGLSSAEPFFLRRTPFFVRTTPFIVRQAGYISIFVPSSPKRRGSASGRFSSAGQPS